MIQVRRGKIRESLRLCQMARDDDTEEWKLVKMRGDKPMRKVKVKISLKRLCHAKNITRPP